MLRLLHSNGVPAHFFENGKWRQRNRQGKRYTVQTSETTHFFNWAQGITSSFQSRSAIEPVCKCLKDRTGIENVGFEITEPARFQLARFFGVPAQTVFFATSSSYCIPYYLRVIGRLHQRYHALLSDEELEATGTFVKGEKHQFEVLTWPNHNERFAEDPISFVPPQEVHIASLDANTLAEKAYSIDGPLFLLASHVGRITGKKLDVAALVDALAARKDPAYLVIDGNMSFLVEPIDVKALGLAGYITGTSKTIGAEPIVGLGYIREDLLNGLKLTEEEKIAFQFSPDTLFAKGTNAAFWTSIIELSCFNSFFPSAFDYFSSGRAALIKSKLQAQLPENPLWLNYFGDSNFFMFLFSKTQPWRFGMPQHETTDGLITSFANHGVLVAEMPREYSFFKDPEKRIRISWNHLNTPEDIDALLRAFATYKEELHEIYRTC